MVRFFPVTALGGRLFVRDIPDHGTWDLSRLSFTDEATLDAMAPRLLFDRKIRAVDEIDAALEASCAAFGSLALWVREDLVDAVRERWEAQGRPS